MSVINTNYLSLVAQNNLQKSQSALGTAIERLSSGLRINSAKDDAAGQAIANRMGAQINGLNQAARNANDGISAAQTTEGALNQINDNLQRIRVLTVQAENGTNSDADLTSIQNEIGQRLEEINRISTETEFNGVKVLASDRELSIQVGANDGQTIKINLQEINVNKLKLSGFNVNDADVKNAKATLTDLTDAGFVSDPTKSVAGVSSAYTKSVQNTLATGADLFAGIADGDAVNYVGTNTGLNKAADGGAYVYSETSGNYEFDVTGAAKADIVSYLTPDAGETVSATVKIGTTTVDVVINSSGNIFAADGTTQLYLDSTGNLTQNTAGTPPAATLTNLTDRMSANVGGTGGTITVGNTVYTADNATGDVFDVSDAQISAAALQNLATSNGTYSVTLDTTTYDVALGAVQTGGTNVYVAADGSLGTSSTTDTTYFVQQDKDGSVTNNTGSIVYVDADGDLTMEEVQAGTRTENPLDVLDAALAQVDALRSDLGAIQNRFESAITNLQTTSNNLASAQSRIQDADYSVEVANMTRAQILQQAGTSVLAQANQIPQGVLSLLR